LDVLVVPMVAAGAVVGRVRLVRLVCS